MCCITNNDHRRWSKSGHIIFSGVRAWLGTILGPFSIIYFRGLGLRIRVRVWVRVRVVLWSG